eukprot:6388745-Amphidinium_carterae.1
MPAVPSSKFLARVWTLDISRSVRKLWHQTILLAPEHTMLLRCILGLPPISNSYFLQEGFLYAFVCLA